MKKRSSALRPVGRRLKQVRGTDGKTLRIVRGGGIVEILEKRRFEFIRIDFQFSVIGISRRIVRSLLIPRAAGKRVLGSVDERHGSREGGGGIVDDVVTRRIPRQRGFGGDKGIQRARIHIGGCRAGVLGVSGKRKETDGGENGQNSDDDDEFGNREGVRSSLRFHAGFQERRAISPF